ncbi:hypothetical protein CXB51_029931 [Gossypium anomalum]|uniref:Uncharacterized protein n=1 Tax=Gossypium anomalum TaxID=47600 RepID=A0A8J6CP03_9ROSI|nr:hypothetical protein CXB51_029931 [Gossypium anomalum]
MAFAPAIIGVKRSDTFKKYSVESVEENESIVVLLLLLCIQLRGFCRVGFIGFGGVYCMLQNF